MIPLRTPLLLALLVVSFLSGLAAAHDHAGCGPATSHRGNLHVWGGGACIGATATTPAAECIVLGHVDVPGLHVLVLNGSGCETGVIFDCDNELFILHQCGLNGLP